MSGVLLAWLPQHFRARQSTLAALQIVSQARKSRHQRIVLQAFALFPPQSPSARYGLLLFSCADDALSRPVSPLHGRCLVGGAAQDGRNGRMRPAGMLSHRRRDGDTFCDDQSYGVDCDSNGPRAQARDRVLECGRDMVIAVAA